MRLALLLGFLAQLIPGLWFLDSQKEYKGLVEGDAITFSIPVEKLPAGTWVQFGITLENGGDKAPRHYVTEVQQGKDWMVVTNPLFNDGLAKYSFKMSSTRDWHPATYMEVFRLRKAVQDSLRVRCRVCSPYATDRTLLSADDEDNKVHLMARCYVGAKLSVLGNKAPKASKKVLLIGNSFTYFYGEPFMLQEIAFSQGLYLDISASLKGGQTFRQHSQLEMTLRTAGAEGYDYAFLQGQSQEPAHFAQDRSGQRDVKLAMCDLVDIIRTYSPDCKVYVENTWSYPSGDCGGFGSLEEFDSLLADGTKQLSIAGRTGISPVGQAFAAVRSEDSPVDLLDTDGKHQSLAGSYLKACITYLMISGKPFSGDVANCTLDPTEAEFLRRVAEKTVLQ